MWIIVFPRIFEESLLPLVVSHMSREISFCYSPSFLLPLLFFVLLCPVSINVYLYLFYLSSAFLWWSAFMYFHILFMCSVLSITIAHLLLSCFLNVPPPVFSGKGNYISLFRNMVVRLIPRHHRYYILYLVLQGTLLVDERYLNFLSI